MHRGLTSFLAALAGAALMAWPASAQPPKSPFRVLYDFAGTAGGASPFAGLIQDASGNLYGTTQSGGAQNAGTVFKAAPDGSAESVLFAFTGGIDGDQPFAGLFLGAKSELYGTTSAGGTNGFGTVFKVKDR